MPHPRPRALPFRLALEGCDARVTNSWQRRNDPAIHPLVTRVPQNFTNSRHDAAPRLRLDHGSDDAPPTGNRAPGRLIRGSRPTGCAPGTGPAHQHRAGRARFPPHPLPPGRLPDRIPSPRRHRPARPARRLVRGGNPCPVPVHSRRAGVEPPPAGRDHLHQRRGPRPGPQGGRGGLPRRRLPPDRGRGRLGRTWESPPGRGLYVSILLRPDLPSAEAGRLTVLGSVAAVDAVEAVSGLRPRIKWAQRPGRQRAQAGRPAHRDGAAARAAGLRGAGHRPQRAPRERRLLAPRCAPWPPRST